ncbi:MAG: hypothetical protein QM778_39180 [Myxococcales bacterium]
MSERFEKYGDFLRNELSGRSFRAQLAFGLSVADRLLGDYTAGVGEQAPERGARLGVALNDLWSFVRDGSAGAPPYEGLAGAIREFYPGEDDDLFYDSEREALSGLNLLATFAKDLKVRTLCHAAVAALELIAEDFIERSSEPMITPELDAAAEHSEGVDAEMARQRSALDALKAGVTDYDEVRQFEPLIEH